MVFYHLLRTAGLVVPLQSVSFGVGILTLIGVGEVLMGSLLGPPVYPGSPTLPELWGLPAPLESVDNSQRKPNQATS